MSEYLIDVFISNYCTDSFVFKVLMPLNYFLHLAIHGMDAIGGALYAAVLSSES